MNERVRLNAKTLAQMIDHTLLKPEATPTQIEALCAEAKEYEFATVCVNPIHVKLAARALAGAPVDVCTVVGFPLGATPTAVKVFETEQALADGAAEIDMVIPIGVLKAGDEKAVREDIAAVVAAAHAAGGIVKVIIEAALLNDEEKKLACALAVAAGADFVKTSTGFGPGGATRHDVSLMRDAVGAEVGVKAAGGIRSYADAQGMVDAGANRLGASAGVRLVSEAAEMKGK
jgi:deoxyribose-phosphate aldolase